MATVIIIFWWQLLYCNFYVRQRPRRKWSIACGRPFLRTASTANSPNGVCVLVSRVSITPGTCKRILRSVRVLYTHTHTHTHVKIHVCMHVSTDVGFGFTFSQVCSKIVCSKLCSKIYVCVHVSTDVGVGCTHTCTHTRSADVYTYGFRV